MKQKRFTLEKKLIVQVKYFEELWVIRDQYGEKIFLGTEETAKKFLKILNQNVKRGKK